jgi:hypothetical protein
MVASVHNKKSYYVGKISKCEKKKCKKTYKKMWKESSRYTRALHKKCDKKTNVFAQCRETVDRSKMNASEDAHTQCIHKKCKKELRKSKSFDQHLNKCMRRF